MTRLSVNINKIATLRNARGGNLPDSGKSGLRLRKIRCRRDYRPSRPDERHIRYSDVREIKPLINVNSTLKGIRYLNSLTWVKEVGACASDAGAGRRKCDNLECRLEHIGTPRTS